MYLLNDAMDQMRLVQSQLLTTRVARRVIHTRGFDF